MAPGRAEKTKASSYLEQYLSGTTGAQQDQRADPHPNRNNDEAPDVPCLRGDKSPSRYPDGCHKDLKSSESDVGDPQMQPGSAFRPRPGGYQPPTPMPLCTSGKAIETAPVINLGMNESALRHSSVDDAGIGFDEGVDPGDYSRRQEEVRAHMTAQQNDPRSRPTATAFQSTTDGDRPGPISYSSIYRNRNRSMDLSELPRRTRQQADEVRALSAEESKALFWQESQAIDAMSAYPNSEWECRPGLARGGYRPETCGTTMAKAAVESRRGYPRRVRASMSGDVNQSVPSSVGLNRVAKAVGQPKQADIKHGHFDVQSEEDIGVRSNGCVSLNANLSVVASEESRKGAVQRRPSSSRKAGSERATLLDEDGHIADFPRTRSGGGSTVAAGSNRPRAVPTPELSLGQALRARAGGLGTGDGTKLSAVGRHITSLDGVSNGLYSRATHLFLSKNNLQSLSGLERFLGVSCLSLAHNLLRRAEDLRPLASLARLEMLSLEGNPVCGAPNYRAHVIDLASPCLKKLDGRKVTPTEAAEAPDIVAAERSLVETASRQRWRCAVSEHMSGLLECHAELREALLTPQGGGSDTGVESRRRVWHQRPVVVTMLMHQILSIMRVEHWPSFEHSDLESVILDEAAELFVELVARKRAAGQRTRDLLECATASLDSPCTALWSQVLNEAQHRTQASEDNAIARCETIRRRESERLRKSSFRTNAAFCRNPSKSVGRSDDKWAIPPYTGRALGVREARVQEAAEPPGACRGQKTPSASDSSLSEGVAHRGSSRLSTASVSAGVPQESPGAGNVAEKRDHLGERETDISANQDRVVVSEEDDETPRARIMEPPVPIKQPRRPVQPLLEQSPGRVDPLTARGVENVMPSPVTFSRPRGETLGFQHEKSVVGEVPSETEASGMRGARAVGASVIGRPSSAPEGGVRGQHGQGPVDPVQDRDGPKGYPLFGPRHGGGGSQRDRALGGRMGCHSPRNRVDFCSRDPSHDVGASPEVTECDSDAHGDDDDYDLCGNSNFSRRFFRDASKVKRLLETLERTDASAGDGLEDEDPDRFLDSLGLVEFKPLAQRLAVTLESAPESLFADPCLSVAEPRTNRALRDQVAALGREVARRADACAEARKLNASIRRQIETARRTRAKNLDTIDMACHTLIVRRNEEIKVLQESRSVAMEAERFDAVLTRLQEYVKKTTVETQEIVSRSEGLAERLRFEMENRGETLSERRRAAEGGLTEWDKAADEDPELGARRRAYDCEIIVLRRRMGGGAGVYRASLAHAFFRLRQQTVRQRRARAWFLSAKERRDTRLLRLAFDALARASRSRAAVTAVEAVRCRAGFDAWRRVTSLSRRLRTFYSERKRAMVAVALMRWRQRVKEERATGVVRKEALERRLEVFRERRVKRVVFRAWYGVVQTAVIGIDARTRSGRGRKGFGPSRRPGAFDFGHGEGLSSGGECGARLRSAEALACRRRLETQGRFALRWWWRQSRSTVLGETVGQRRALKRWRRFARESRLARRVSALARERYMVTLGRRALISWSVIAATRARRRAGAVAFIASLSSILRRQALKRWASQAALFAIDTEQTMVALEHCYDGCLRAHLRAWSALAAERRLLRRGFELLLRCRLVGGMAMGFRAWRRYVACVRDIDLRDNRVRAWTAAARRRRRLSTLSHTFHAWVLLSRRTVIIHSIVIRFASRRRHLALSWGFRAFSLSARRSMMGPRIPSHRLEADEKTLAKVAKTRTVLEEHVGQLRARLTEKRSLALERREEVRKVAVEVLRSERKRLRCVKRLRMEEEKEATSALASASGGDGSTGLACAGALSSLPEGTKREEGELFRKLQAEALEMEQRVVSAEEVVERARAEAARRAGNVRAEVKEALLEAKRLKKEVDGHETLRAQMDREAAQAASQAAALTGRCAEAEQELRFETNRHLQRRRAKDDESARLREAAATAESRLVVAENALRRKGAEIKDLRARAARQGLGREKGVNAAGLQFEVFAATASARVAAEGCSEAVGKRRAVAGLAVGEALRLSGAQDAVLAVDRESSAKGKMEEARRLVGESTVDEKREAAQLVLRRAEAKLRRTADLSVRASLDCQHQPLADRRQQSARAGDVRCPADTCATRSTVEEHGAGKLGGGSRERHLVSPRGRAGQGALLATSIAGAVVRGGLRELREEIADLEGKILRRLGSGRASPSREASGTEEARHSTTAGVPTMTTSTEHQTTNEHSYYYNTFQGLEGSINGGTLSQDPISPRLSSATSLRDKTRRPVDFERSSEQQAWPWLLVFSWGSPTVVEYLAGDYGYL